MNPRYYTLSMLEISAQVTQVNTYHTLSVPVYDWEGCRTAVAVFRDSCQQDFWLLAMSKLHFGSWPFY